MNFEVIRQTIRRTDSAPIIADSINYLTAKFRFSSDWADLEKHVTFTLGANVYDKTLDADDEIKANQGLNLTEGVWTVGVVGVEVVEGEMVERITADTVSILVTMAGALGGEAFPEISGAFGEIILQSEADRVAAEAARVAAEEEREAFFAEAQTGINEAARVEAEELRAEAEAARDTAEGLRDTAEQSRDSAEDSRIAAESARAFYAAYNAATSYILGNKVSYNGSSYIWTDDGPSVAGTQPPNTGWLLIASRGDDGTSGVYVGSDPIPEGYNVQIDPDGDATDVVLQFGTMPTPDADYLGVTALYTGTDGTYKNGGTYICVSSGGATPIYSWSRVGEDVSGAISTHNTDAGAHAELFGAVDAQINQLTDHADEIADNFAYINNLYLTSLNPDEAICINGNRLILPTYNEGTDGEVVHPCVRDLGKKWNGYRYWMAMTPYQDSSNVYENPSILASNDKVNWSVPTGATNPVVTKPAGGFNADPYIFMDHTFTLMYMVYKKSVGTTFTTMLTSTADGAVWTNPIAILNTTGISEVISPSIIWNGSSYNLWYIDGVALTLQLRTSTDLYTWSSPSACTISVPAGKIIWHLEVSKFQSQYHMIALVSATSGTAGDLYFGVSSDGESWTLSASPTLTGSGTYVSGAWDKSLYKASMIPIIDSSGLKYGLFYGSLSDFYVGYTEITFDKTIKESIKLTELLFANNLVSPWIFGDTFNRNNSALSLGTSSCGIAWTAIAGVLGVSSNKAYAPANGDNKASVDLGTPNYYMRFTIVGESASSEAGMQFRRAGNTSFWKVSINPTNKLKLSKFVSGVSTIVDLLTTTAGVSYEVEVVCNGDVIQVYVNGRYLYKIIDSTYNTSTIIAMQIVTTDATIDNLVIKTL